MGVVIPFSKVLQIKAILVLANTFYVIKHFINFFYFSSREVLTKKAKCVLQYERHP